MNSLGLGSVLRLLGPQRWRSSRCQVSVSSTHAANNPGNNPKLTFHNYKSHTDQCSSLIAVDALAHVKKGLRSLFSRRKKKKPPKQPEPTPSSNEAPSHTTAAAAAATPVEAPATSNRSIDEAEDATETGQPPAAPPHPAAAPTTTTAAALMPDPPPAMATAPTSSGHPASQPSQRQPHISAPSQIEEAREIDLNFKTEEGDVKTESGDVKTGSSDLRPRLRPDNETRMSATSGPMGDHMAEVWRDSDVEAKEGSPVELGTKEEGVMKRVEGEGEGGKF